MVTKIFNVLMGTLNQSIYMASEAGHIYTLVKPRLLARILAVFIVAHAQAIHLCCQPRRWNWAEHRALQSTVKRARAARHMRDEKLIV